MNDTLFEWTKPGGGQRLMLVPDANGAVDVMAETGSVATIVTLPAEERRLLQAWLATLDELAAPVLSDGDGPLDRPPSGPAAAAVLGPSPATQYISGRDPADEADDRPRMAQPTTGEGN